MRVIKTPTGLIPIDDPVKEVTEEQYNNLSDKDKNNGTYFITDSEDGVALGDVATILGTIGATDIADIHDGTITGILKYFNEVKANKADLNLSNNKIKSNESNIKIITDDLAFLKMKFDNLKLGIRNIALNTNMGKDNWIMESATGATNVETYIDENNIKAAKLTQINSSGASCVIKYNNINKRLFSRDKNYVISVDIYSNTNCDCNIGVMDNAKTNRILDFVKIKSAIKMDTWNKVELVLQATDDFTYDTDACLIIDVGPRTNGDYFILKNLKIVEGDKTISDWFPAIEDIQSQIDSIKKQLNTITTGGGGGFSDESSSNIDSAISSINNQTKMLRSGLSTLNDNKAENTELEMLKELFNVIDSSKADTKIVEQLISDVKIDESNIDNLINDKDKITKQLGLVLSSLNELKSSKIDETTYTDKMKKIIDMINKNTSYISSVANLKADNIALNNLGEQVNLLYKENKGYLSALTDKLTEVNNSISKLILANECIQSDMVDKASNSDLFKLKDAVINIVHLIENNVTIDTVKELSDKVISNKDSITELSESKASKVDLNKVESNLSVTMNNVDNINMNKLDKTELEGIYKRMDDSNTISNNINNRMHYSESSGDGDFIIIHPNTFEPDTQRGSLFVTGNANSEDTACAIINVLFGKINITNLGSLKLTASIENNAVRIDGTTDWMRLFIIES